MPGINTSGTPSTSNYLLGRGSLTIYRLNTVTGKFEEGRQIGHMPQFSLTSEIQTVDHVSSRGGVRTTDRRVIASQSLNFSIQTDEVLDFDNLALWMQGQAGSIANPSSAGNITDRLVTDTAVKGRHYIITNAAAGAQMYDINAGTFSMKRHATTLGSAVAMTAGVDYVLNAAYGTIFIPTTSAVVAGDNMWFSYTAGGEQPLSRVNIQTQQSSAVGLRFNGINAADGSKTFMLQLNSVTLLPEGEMSFLGSEYAVMTLSGVAGRNELGYPSSPVGEVIYHLDG